MIKHDLEGLKSQWVGHNFHNFSTTTPNYFIPANHWSYNCETFAPNTGCGFVNSSIEAIDSKPTALLSELLQM
jgi:hypothetical protein